MISTVFRITIISVIVVSIRLPVIAVNNSGIIVEYRPNEITNFIYII